ncbi:hypothetical protein O1D97_17735 [Marinomonas sp. 15G1-11]|uniref:Tryptophan synthase subunit beta like protein n=1 Tax=Marinomonas phaeophyticola TaxID=3004091 RepID=A0ABT4JYB9_9GAMM|nr:hypothetical protein [Marinomonas sp. 15G1-11]MCZ2723399.1 hypothetical protein [Marinomonas sp. 15G1-11]
MLYAKIDEHGVIIDVSTEQSDEYRKLVAPNDPNVTQILEDKISNTQAQGMLSNSDSDMMRILEDLIDLLTEKRLLQFTELPIAAQKKILSRKWVRGLHVSNDDNLIDEHFPEDNDSLI